MLETKVKIKGEKSNNILILSHPQGDFTLMTKAVKLTSLR